MTDEAQRRVDRLEAEGCVSCGVRESEIVYQLPIGVFCDSCHEIRSAVITNILRLLGNERLSRLVELQEALLLVDKESRPD